MVAFPFGSGRGIRRRILLCQALLWVTPSRLVRSGQSMAKVRWIQLIWLIRFDGFFLEELDVQLDNLT